MDERFRKRIRELDGPELLHAYLQAGIDVPIELAANNLKWLQDETQAAKLSYENTKCHQSCHCRPCDTRLDYWRYLRKLLKSANKVRRHEELVMTQSTCEHPTLHWMFSSYWTACWKSEGWVYKCCACGRFAYVKFSGSQRPYPRSIDTHDVNIPPNVARIIYAPPGAKFNQI